MTTPTTNQAQQSTPVEATGFVQRIRTLSGPDLAALPGNHGDPEYIRGLTNGLLLALSFAEGTKYTPIDGPIGLAAMGRPVVAQQSVHAGSEAPSERRDAFEAQARRTGHINFMRMAGDPETYDDMVLRAEYRGWCAAQPVEAATEHHNITRVERLSDQSVGITFTSARACSAFSRSIEPGRPVEAAGSAAKAQDNTITLSGHQLRMALDLINPDGPTDREQLDDELTFGVRQHRDDAGKEGTGMCCWNDDTDGVLPLDGEYTGQAGNAQMAESAVTRYDLNDNSRNYADFPEGMMRVSASGDYVLYRDHCRIVAAQPAPACSAQVATEEQIIEASANVLLAGFQPGDIAYDIALVRKLESSLAAPAATGAQVASEWRSLALQFDGHRMQALSHLRTLLNFADHAPAVVEFLAAPPLPGEAVLAERIALLAAPATALVAQEPTELTSRLRTALAANGVISHADTLSAIGEIERYYGGMMAWKQTAEKKDRDLNNERMARVNDRIAERAAAPEQDRAMVDLMPKRAAFLKWAKDRALDVTEDKDVWGRRKFLHLHIQSLWEGWFNAPAVYSSESAAAPADLSQAATDVLAERRRQVEQEGWTPEHDDEHSTGEMAEAAACYVTGRMEWSVRDHHQRWPWSHGWWKPKDRRHDLVRAGALILAEVERLDRATHQPTPTGEKA